MNAHFKDSGYYAAARGKTFHSSKSGFYRWEERKTVYPSEWHEYPNVEKKFKPTPNYYSGFTEDFASADIFKDEDDQDWGTASFCIDQLGSMKERRDANGVPTFLACGLIKPHLPWAVPQKYYDLYPLDEIEMDWLNDWDLDDIPKEGIRLARPHKEDANVTKLGREKAAVQGYLASIAYADMNLGRILDAYEAMPQSERDNTIVVLWSDHGYHHGQKKVRMLPFLSQNCCGKAQLLFLFYSRLAFLTNLLSLLLSIISKSGLEEEDPLGGSHRSTLHLDRSKHDSTGFGKPPTG